eukprot:UN06566
MLWTCLPIPNGIFNTIYTIVKIILEVSHQVHLSD